MRRPDRWRTPSGGGGAECGAGDAHLVAGDANALAGRRLDRICCELADVAWPKREEEQAVASALAVGRRPAYVIPLPKST